MPVTTAPWRARRNRFKEELAAGRHPVAMWVTIPWAPIIEIMGCGGLDAAFICLEHTSFDLEKAELLITTAELAGVTPIVRVPSLDVPHIGRILDAGAQGIIFPHIESADAAELARKSLEYAPKGIRGWAGSHVRYNLWQGGSGVRVLRNPDATDRGVYSTEYVEKSRSDLVSIFIIESLHGVENLEKILDAGQPDLIYFGWGDFSAEVEFDFDRCLEAATRVYGVCRERGIGISLAPGQASPTEAYPGCFAIVGTDALVASSAFAASIKAAKESLGIE